MPEKALSKTNGKTTLKRDFWPAVSGGLIATIGQLALFHAQSIAHVCHFTQENKDCNETMEPGNTADALQAPHSTALCVRLGYL